MAAAGNPTFGAGGTTNKLTGLTLKEVSRYFKESVVAGKTVWKCTVNDCKGEVGSSNGMHKYVQHHHRDLMRLGGFKLKVGEGNTREGNADIGIGDRGVGPGNMMGLGRLGPSVCFLCSPIGSYCHFRCLSDSSYLGLGMLWGNLASFMLLGVPRTSLR